MLSITYFWRDDSSSGLDSSMHASLRRSERAEGGAGSEREAWFCTAREGRLPSPIPLGSGVTVQSGDSGTPSG